jgi:hypothetical protein
LRTRPTVAAFDAPGLDDPVREKPWEILMALVRWLAGVLVFAAIFFGDLPVSRRGR